MTPRVVSYDEAAKLLDCSRGTIFRRIASGELLKGYTGRRLANGKRETGVLFAEAPAAQSLARACATIDTAAELAAPDGPAAPGTGGLVTAEPVAAPAAPAGPRNEPATPSCSISDSAGATAPVSLGSGPRTGQPTGATAPVPAPITGTAQLGTWNGERGTSLVPLTPSGLPDLAAMKALGMDSQAAEYARRLEAVVTLKQRQARAPKGDLEFWAQLTAEEYEISVATLYRWRKALESAGPAALVPAWGGQRGQTVLPGELCGMIKAAYLTQNQRTVSDIYRSIVRPFYRALGRANLPNVSTVSRYLRKHVVPLERVTFREGKSAYQARIEPKVVRDPLTCQVNEIWCADHRLWDVMVLDADGQGTGWGKHGAQSCPCGSGRERRECCSVVRPWLTMLADVRTAAFIGWRLGRTPTAAGVCHALRSGIKTFGLPQTLYRDNGKEFTANRLGGKSQRGKPDGGWFRNPRRADILPTDERWAAFMPAEVEGSGFFRTLGIGLVTALPFSAWSKPIESFFRAFSLQWENNVPCWCGRDSKEKPEALARLIGDGFLLTWDEFAEIFAEQTAKWNLSHVCGEREAPPAALYAGHEPVIPDDMVLAYLCQKQADLEVRQEGLVLDGDPYMSTALAPYVGMRVHVRWDPEDPDVVFVYGPGGEVLAVPPALRATWQGWGEANVDARRAGKAQRAYLARTREEIRAVVAAAGPGLSDPTGAYQTVWRRLQEQKRQAQLPAALLQQAQAQQCAAAEAAAEQERAAKEREPARTPSIYAQIEMEVRRQAE